MLQPENLVPLSDAERQLFTQLVPEDHYLRRLVQVVDFERFRPVLATVYCQDDGRPPLDPVFMLKLEVLALHYRLSDRELMKQAQVNVAHRLFLGLSCQSPLPHHTSMTYFRERVGAERMQEIFHVVLGRARELGLVRNRLRLKDATHIIANIAVPSTIRLVAQTRDELLEAVRPFAAARADEETQRAEALRLASDDLPDQERLLRRVTHLRAVLAWTDAVPHAEAFHVAAAAGQEKLRSALVLAHKVLAEEKPTAWKLKAHKYYYIPLQDIGVAGIVIEPTEDLFRLQKKLIDAVAPYTVKTGTVAAFATTKEAPDIDEPKQLIDYVAKFVPNASGKKFNPHVTIGIASQAYLNKMLNEKFETFTFSPVGASVYQLGNFGTARKKLKSLDLKPGDTPSPCPLPQGGGEGRVRGPLPSWNDGKAKKSIIEFVAQVTKPGSADFVPPADRIAVFDNDGTLWCEQPMAVQLAFAMDRVKALAPKHPEWKEKQPFKAVLDGDLKSVAALDERGIIELVMASHAGMTTDEFEAIVKNWIATAKHPRFTRPYTECVYQPMLELLAYLRANGFKTYVFSGGGIEFMRPWATAVYGVPPEQVIGSSIKTKFELRKGKPVLVRLPEIDFINDKENKPSGIHKFIGRLPIAAFGNSDGDWQMLQWVTAGKGPRFGLIVHHTNGEREYAYDREVNFGRLDKALDEGRTRGWSIVDMKKDWKVVFPVEK